MPDGRALAYSDHGDGPVVLFCQGTPGTRLLPPGLIAAALDEGLRLITPDRPGFGRSDPQPGRTLADWAADVAALLDALDLAAVDVIGGSGGGPYAVVTGVELPSRVGAVALLCPGVPADAPVHGTVVPRDRDALRRRGETFHRLLRDDPDGFVAMLGYGDDPDFLAGMREAFRQGPAAYVEDHTLNDSQWSDLLPRLHRPTRIWHGTEDVNIPLAAVRWMADRMPGAELTVLPGFDHDIEPAWPEAFGWLRRTGVSRGPRPGRGPA